MASVGSWDPQQTETPEQIDIAELQPTLDWLAGFDEELPEQKTWPLDQLESCKALMTAHKNAWLTLAEQLEDSQLLQLVRFFTLAETLPGWEAGSKSPVIWLCRTLKKRGLFPDKELIQWIKTNTENKYLPYGNPLDL